MKRNLLFGGILALVALLVWSANTVPPMTQSVLATGSHASAPAETPGPPTPCEACAQATLAALTQEQINLSALQAQATATADILRAQNLATSNAAVATQSVAQTQAMLKANLFWAQVADPTDNQRANTQATSLAAAASQSNAQTQAMRNANALQAQVAVTADRFRANALATDSAVQTEVVLQQARLQLASRAATQSAAAAAAQQRMDQSVSGTGTAIVGAAFQAQFDLAQKPEPSTVLWMWLTPVLILVAAVLALWGASRWQAQRRTGGRSEAPR